MISVVVDTGPVLSHGAFSFVNQLSTTSNSSKAK